MQACVFARDYMITDYSSELFCCAVTLAASDADREELLLGCDVRHSPATTTRGSRVPIEGYVSEATAAITTLYWNVSEKCICAACEVCDFIDHITTPCQPETTMFDPWIKHSH